MGWSARSAVLFGGDSLPRRKPDPDQLLAACEALGIEPAQAVYVGDDERDIIAARAAGMPSIVALWGYRLPGIDPLDWRGDTMIEQPSELLDPAIWPTTVAHPL